MSPVIFHGYGGVPPHVLHVLVFLLVADVAGCVLLLATWVRWWALVVAALIIGAGVWWLRVDLPVEGGILHVFRPGKGVTVGDLLAVQGWLVALVIIGRFVRQRVRLRRGSRTARHSAPR